MRLPAGNNRRDVFEPAIVEYNSVESTVSGFDTEQPNHATLGVGNRVRDRTIWPAVTSRCKADLSDHKWLSMAVE